MDDADEIYYENDKIIKTPTVEGIAIDNGMGEVLYRAMLKHKNKTAQIDALTGETDTFEELLNRCIRTALTLKGMHINADDIICLCTYNHLDSIVPFIATTFIGAVVSSLDPSLSLADTAHLINLVKPRIIFVVPEAVRLIEDALEATSVKTCIVVFGPSDQHMMFSTFLLKRNREEDFRPAVITDTKNTAIIFFSSGTTGFPKGICVNHYALLLQAGGMVSTGYVSSTNLLFTSLYWITAVMFLTSSILNGGTRLVCSSFDPTTAWTYIDKYKVSFMFIAPVLAIAMIRTGRPEGIDTTSLLEVLTGGSAMTISQMREFRDLLPGTNVTQGYGQTEVAGAITLFKSNKRRDVLLAWSRPDSCGRPIKGIWYKIVDPETEEILGANCRGELRLKSECVMNGYYEMDSSEAWDTDGWLKTGDIAYYDEDFCFYIVDRIKEMLKFRSWHVVPAVLEEILKQHPAVQSVVVVGIPHEEDGDHPAAVVVLNDGYENKITSEEIEKFLEERVDDRQRLRGGVKIVKELAMTPTGKVKKKLIRDLILNGEL